MTASDDLRTIGELEAHAEKIVAQVARTGKPMVITVGGRAKAVLLDVASHEEREETLALLKILALGQRQVEEKKTRTAQTVPPAPAPTASQKMTPFRVLLTEDAETDLRELIEFIDQREGAVRADHCLDQFERVIRRLSSLPTKYRVVPELRSLGVTEFREAFFKPYRVVFRVISKTVYVYLVCDGRRDMRSLLERRILSSLR